MTRMMAEMEINVCIINISAHESRISRQQDKNLVLNALPFVVRVVLTIHI